MSKQKSKKPKKVKISVELGGESIELEEEVPTSTFILPTVVPQVHYPTAQDFIDAAIVASVEIMQNPKKWKITEGRMGIERIDTPIITRDQIIATLRDQIAQKYGKEAIPSDLDAFIESQKEEWNQEINAQQEYIVKRIQKLAPKLDEEVRRTMVESRVKAQAQEEARRKQRDLQALQQAQQQVSHFVQGLPLAIDAKYNDLVKRYGQPDNAGTKESLRTKTKIPAAWWAGRGTSILGAVFSPPTKVDHGSITLFENGEIETYDWYPLGDWNYVTENNTKAVNRKVKKFIKTRNYDIETDIVFTEQPMGQGGVPAVRIVLNGKDLEEINAVYAKVEEAIREAGK